MSFRVRNSSNRYNIDHNTSVNLDYISDRDVQQLKKSESYKFIHKTKGVDDYIPKSRLDKEDPIMKDEIVRQIFVFDKRLNEWKLVKESEQNNYEPKIESDDPVDMLSFPEIPDFESFKTEKSSKTNYKRNS